MKRYTLVLGLAAAAAVSAPLSAQGRGRNIDGIPPGHRPPPGMCRIWIDGVPPGRQPRPTDCATAEANRPVNSRVIYGENTRRSGRIYDRNGDRVYDRNGDGVYDRRDRRGDNSGPWWDPTRRDSDRRVDGEWRSAGTDRNGNRVYVRQRYDSNGNRIIEYARRDSFGRYIVFDREVVNRGGRRSDDRRSDRDRDDDDDDRYEDRDRDGRDDRVERARAKVKDKKGKGHKGKH